MDSPIIAASKTLVDKYGKPIGWPSRSGQLYMIDGQFLVKQQLVEIIINPTASATPGSVYSCPDQPNLRNTALWGIEVFTADVIANSPAAAGLSGDALVTDALMGDIFISMQDYASFNFMQYQPARCFQYQSRTANAQLEKPQGLIGQHVNWPLVTINLTNTAAFANNTYSFLMNVLYSYYDNWQRDGLGENFGSRS
jgi:hypothetical protein